MREMALPLARHEHFEEMRELKLQGASAEEIQKLQERQQQELKQWLSVNKNKLSSVRVDPQEALQAIAKAAQSHTPSSTQKVQKEAKSVTTTATLATDATLTNNAIPTTVAEHVVYSKQAKHMDNADHADQNTSANFADSTTKTAPVLQDATGVKLESTVQLDSTVPNKSSAKQSYNQDVAERLDTTNSLLTSDANLAQEEHDADLKYQSQRTLVLRKRTIVVPHMPIEPSTTPAGKKILSLRRKNGAKGGIRGSMNLGGTSAAED